VYTSAQDTEEYHGDWSYHISPAAVLTVWDESPKKVVYASMAWLRVEEEEGTRQVPREDILTPILGEPPEPSFVGPLRVADHVYKVQGVHAAGCCGV